MCSNCSGDDLRPESFATFDVSSPEVPHSFAGRRRRQAKTIWDFADFDHAHRNRIITGDSSLVGTHGRFGNNRKV